MSHGTHRSLLLAESILLMAPATVLVTLGFAWSARFLAVSVRDGNWQDPTTWMSAAIAAGLVGALSGWWLLIRYLRGGPAALQRGAGLAWAGAATGLVAALGGAWMSITGNGLIFAVGVLALLPLAHLRKLRNGCGA